MGSIPPLVLATKTHICGWQLGGTHPTGMLSCLRVFFITLFEALYLIHQRGSRINIWKPCGLIEREIKTYRIGLNVFKASETIPYLAG